MAGPEPSRRPRLSLQTKSTYGSSGRTRNAYTNVDPKSPTAFNTLSNVYVTAIERSTPVQSTPLTAIKIHQPLKLQTDPDTLGNYQQTVQTPFAAALPDTPLSANPISPVRHMDIALPSTMTATPPLSAGPVDSSERKVFTFASVSMNQQVMPSSPAQTRRRVMYAALGAATRAPYSHNRSLHSILRNSPLPPSSAKSPSSPRRQSVRLQEKAARRVGYESPLTQTITTEKYTKSHIDLLVEEASPYTPTPAPEDSDMVLDLAMAYSGDETRDGGQTPGPFEEMRRRMTNLATETPILSPRPDGIRKRKRKEKKRKWVWTIGQDDEGSESGAMAALRAAAGEASTPRAILVGTTMSALMHKEATPEPLTAVKISVDQAESESDLVTDEERMDVEMSDTSSMLSSRATTPYSIDLDMKTPTVPTAANRDTESVQTSPVKKQRVASAGLIDSENGSRRDTPIPPDLADRVEPDQIERRVHSQD
ncbi:hypothetical protein F5Y19DRAFT_197819 [Xylariaceae sp. FL1651]|nr:hypothetical protein F5Y19DRAFT_197819 [Xylariaceae sp. FL1651]